VWSIALRRKGQKEQNAIIIVNKLAELIRESLVVMCGPVRQELLSGISDKGVYDHLKSKLSSFEDLPITTYDYETAAGFHNICRKKGVQGSHIDFLICAAASNNNLLIFTTDQDFQHYAKHLPIELLKF
jgi:predicted nucleic acid-binding protein